MNHRSHDARTRAPAVGDPMVGLDMPISWIEDIYGQDFGLKLRFNDAPASLEFEARRRRAEETATLFKNAGSAIARAWGKLASWNRNRVSADALRALPDYRLADLGITRDQIDAIVSGRIEPVAPDAADPARSAEIRSFPAKIRTKPTGGAVNDNPPVAA